MISHELLHVKTIYKFIQKVFKLLLLIKKIMEGERRPSKRNSKKENKKHPYKRRFVEDDTIANKKQEDE